MKNNNINFVIGTDEVFSCLHPEV